MRLESEMLYNKHSLKLPQQDFLLDLQSHIPQSAVFAKVDFVFEFGFFSSKWRHPLNGRHGQISLATSFD